ncbi:sarcosine oxidase subunit gamma [Oricola thermophila]|uniref:Sarcosine oxidase subunit gamma n=1 Tax=Oricola thermophila TaxID=2742145 RepID=A0A6N1V8R4_9HYPH|nr:sarcosine oxidase subunit gamma family protein [Oricola thermophila]QKV17334.1 sarcosine oxidase subunit gamma [Oricola thermophila]
MADLPPFIADPVRPEFAKSPLSGAYEHGEFGAIGGTGPGVVLLERFGIAIAEVASWRGSEAKIRNAIRQACGLSLKTAPGSGTIKGEKSAFNIAPRRWLVSGGEPALAAALDTAVAGHGTVTDLGHGRTVIRIDGEKSRWVLAKIFAVDLADEALARGNGLATAHHDISARIQRVGPNAFDVYVFRSFARSFWHLLCRSSEEVGYRVE